MNAPTPTVTIPLSEILELLAHPDEPFQLVADGPGVHVMLLARVDIPAGAPPVPPPVAPVSTITSRKTKAQTTTQNGSTGDHECDECPRRFGTLHALAVHRARTHGRTKAAAAQVSRPRVPEVREEPTPPPVQVSESSTPIGRMSFDPDRTRAAAAASI